MGGWVGWWIGSGGSKVRDVIPWDAVTATTGGRVCPGILCAAQSPTRNTSSVFFVETLDARL